MVDLHGETAQNHDMRCATGENHHQMSSAKEYGELSDGVYESHPGVGVCTTKLDNILK